MGKIYNKIFPNEQSNEDCKILENCLRLAWTEPKHFIKGNDGHLMMLSDEFGIELEATDATPKNLKTLDSIVALVERKLHGFFLNQAVYLLLQAVAGVRKILLVAVDNFFCL